MCVVFREGLRIAIGMTAIAAQAQGSRCPHPAVIRPQGPGVQSYHHIASRGRRNIVLTFALMAMVMGPWPNQAKTENATRNHHFPATRPGLAKGFFSAPT